MVLMFRTHWVNWNSKDDKIALNLIAEIEAETPFTALGFYSIEKSTLTSLLSTIVTYLIIVIQFKQSEDSSDTSSSSSIIIS